MLLLSIGLLLLGLLVVVGRLRDYFGTLEVPLRMTFGIYSTGTF